MKAQQLSTTLAGNSGDGHTPLWRTPVAVSLRPGTLRRLEESLKKQWKRYQRALRRCQERFSEEAVHNSRVQTRRLLSMLELLGPFLPSRRLEKAQTALKPHLDIFDDLRDTHVQLLAVEKLLRRFPVLCALKDYLQKREDRFTRKTRRDIKCFETKRVRKIIAACREDVKRARRDILPSQTNALLVGAIDAAFAATSQLRDRIDRNDTRTIHCTRIAFKKFRYMIETLGDCLPVANEKISDKMHRYQTMMGEIQDAEVLLQTFKKFVSRKKMKPKAARRMGAELLRRRRALVRKYMKAADQLLSFWPLARAAESNQLAVSAHPLPGRDAADSGHELDHKAPRAPLSRGTRPMP